MDYPVKRMDYFMMMTYGLRQPLVLRMEGKQSFNDYRICCSLCMTAAACCIIPKSDGCT